MRTLLAILVLVTAAAPARADVVMPAPTNCPRGQVGTTSHGGPRCELEPPKDCPPGWGGVMGGTCMLRPCSGDDDCDKEKGEACVEHAVCLEAFEDEFYDYNEDEQHGENPPRRLLQSPDLLAGPPMQKKRRPTPITRYNATNLCSKEIPCAAPRTCQPEKLCVRSGTRAVAYKGTNVSLARVARKTAAPLTTSAASPTEATSPNVTVPPKRGCSGCASGGPASGAAILASLALVALAIARRRAAAARSAW
jgi:hypothetical protein